MVTYLDLLPDDKKSLVKLIHTEATKLSKQQINAGRHGADSSARAMTSLIVLRKHAWLRSIALLPETRSKIKDLPFEGTTLFFAKADETLSQRKKNKQAACSFGIIPGSSQRYPYRHQYQQPSQGYQWYK